MKLKYESEIGRIKGCPPKNARPCERPMPAFRFVHEERRGEWFHPVAIKSPSRQLYGKQKCDSYGISLFDTLENAQTRYKELSKTHRSIRKTIGTHIAEGTIDETDGVATPPATSGHFTLFEAFSVDLSAKFEVTFDLRT